MAHINANQDLFQEKFGVKIAMQYSTLAMFFDDLAKHEPVFPQRGAQTFLPTESASRTTTSRPGRAFTPGSRR